MCTIVSTGDCVSFAILGTNTVRTLSEGLAGDGMHEAEQAGVVDEARVGLSLTGANYHRCHITGGV
jgi:hypothetical protein